MLITSLWVMGCHSKITKKKRYKKTLASILLAFFLPHLVASREANCHGVSCPTEGPTWQGMEGGFQPAASKKLRPSIQQYTKDWILPTTMWESLEVDPFPVDPWVDYSPWRDPFPLHSWTCLSPTNGSSHSLQPQPSQHIMSPCPCTF